jgi:hypothetical protein
MPRKKDEALELGGVKEYIIPEALIEEFRTEPRVIMIHRPDGLWPVPLHLLKESPFFEKLFSNREFASDYQVVIMRK